MTEPIKTPTSEVYANEAKYMKFLQRHANNFDRLVESVPENREDIRKTLKDLYHVEPGELIDREKLAKLKKQNRPLFEEVTEYCKNFAEKMKDISSTKLK